MAEDTLQRYHTPDKTALIRGSSEAGFKAEWQNIFHPEEESVEQSVGQVRFPGGGQGALDRFFENPEGADPELRLLFSDFLSDVYAISDKEELWEAAEEESQKVNHRLRELESREGKLSQTEKKALEALETESQFLDFMKGAGFERQLERNFVKWLSTEGEEVYDFTGVPKRIREEIENRELRGEVVKLESNIGRIVAKNARGKDSLRIDMRAWLNAWTDPEAELKGFGITFQNGNLKSVALNSKLYGITPVLFWSWAAALGGERFEDRRNGVKIKGVDFGQAHKIAPGIGEAAIKQTIRTLEIDGIGHPHIPIIIKRLQPENEVTTPI